MRGFTHINSPCIAKCVMTHRAGDKQFETSHIEEIEKTRQNIQCILCTSRAKTNTSTSNFIIKFPISVERNKREKKRKGKQQIEHKFLWFYTLISKYKLNSKFNDEIFMGKVQSFGRLTHSSQNVHILLFVIWK